MPRKMFIIHVANYRAGLEYINYDSKFDKKRQDKKRNRKVWGGEGKF